MGAGLHLKQRQGAKAVQKETSCEQTGSLDLRMASPALSSCSWSVQGRKQGFAEQGVGGVVVLVAPVGDADDAGGSVTQDEGGQRLVQGWSSHPGDESQRETVPGELQVEGEVGDLGNDVGAPATSREHVQQPVVADRSRSGGNPAACRQLLNADGVNVRILVVSTWGCACQRVVAAADTVGGVVVGAGEGEPGMDWGGLALSVVHEGDVDSAAGQGGQGSVGVHLDQRPG